MPAYYNEFDPYAAQWLRNLIAAGHIAPGDVDERSILEVTADDLRGYEQCHFFAGIGGWSAALRLAGWPDDRPVWTGSCPCQPFSAAGKQRGSEDERHLWPAFFRLIRERLPSKVFGEQVTGPAGLAWLDHVLSDLEDAGYAAAAADLCAAGVGAPHIRQRLYWVADALRGGTEHGPGEGVGAEAAANGSDGGVSRKRLRLGVEGAACGLADSDGGDASAEGLQRGWQHGQQQEDSCACGLGDAAHEPRERNTGGVSSTEAQCGGEREFDGYSAIGPEYASAGMGGGLAGPTNGHWRDADWLRCRDGKWRPIEPGTFPLATGIPARMGRLRAYGNAIVPQLAAVFVMANLEGNRPR